MTCVLLCAAASEKLAWAQHANTADLATPPSLATAHVLEAWRLTLAHEKLNPLRLVRTLYRARACGGGTGLD